MSIRNSVKRLFRWLVEPWPIYLTVGVLIATWYSPRFFVTCKADQIRISGYFLQLFGIITVAIGLKNTRKLFNQPNIIERFVTWAKRFPNIFAKPQTVNVSGAITGFGALDATGNVVSSMDKSLEDRIKILEANYKQLQTDFEQAQKDFTNKVVNLKDAITAESDIRKKTDTIIQKKLEEFSVGGLHIESMGLVWLILGVTFATLPTEIAYLLSRFSLMSW